MAQLWLGTSGWVYKHWMGTFYPARMPGEQLLAFYARHFRSVEINYTFYQLPPRSTFEAWREQTPPGFLFAVKASRYITHMKKLADPEEPLRRLMEAAGGLGEKLGPILFQLPGWWRANLERLRGFLAALRPYRPHRFAFELRHRSWLTSEVADLLAREEAALCLPVGPGVPLDVRLTAPWTYVRFHSGERGICFGDDELWPWAERIRDWLGQGHDAYVYFNNDPDVCAIRNARRLREMLAAQPASAADRAGPPPPRPAAFLETADLPSAPR